MVTKMNYPTKGLDDWEREFASIYGEVDRRKSIPEVWLLQVEAATKLAEYLRRDHLGEALQQLAIVFGTTCRLVARCRSEPEDRPFHIVRPFPDIVWWKYPNICPVCVWDYCMCPVWRAQYEDMSSTERDRLKKENATKLESCRGRALPPMTLDDFTAMFHKIYKSTHYDMPVEAIGFHFMEEVGEVAEAIRKLREGDNLPGEEVQKLQASLENEIADVFSWINSLINKLDFLVKKTQLLQIKQLPEYDGLRLSDLVWDVFSSDGVLWCPQCEQRPCTHGCIPELDKIKRGLSLVE